MTYSLKEIIMVVFIFPFLTRKKLHITHLTPRGTTHVVPPTLPSHYKVICSVPHASLLNTGWGASCDSSPSPVQPGDLLAPPSLVNISQ